MASEHVFPPLPPASLDRDDSVAYLIGLQAKRRGCRRRPCSARRRGGSSIVRVRTVGPTASQPCLDCGNQDEQDGESETEAYGGGLGNLVRLEFRILCRDHHVAGVHPSRGRVEYF